MSATPINTKEILEAARLVPCIEVIDGPAPERAQKFGGHYYPDQVALLTEVLRGLKRERFLVALNDLGLPQIYRKPAKAKGAKQ